MVCDSVQLTLPTNYSDVCEDTILLRTVQIQALGHPRTQDHQSLSNWIGTKKEPAPLEYRDFISHADDFVTAIGGSISNQRSETGDYIKEGIRAHLTDYPNSLLTVRLCFEQNGRHN